MCVRAWVRVCVPVPVPVWLCVCMSFIKECRWTREASEGVLDGLEATQGVLRCLKTCEIDSRRLKTPSDNYTPQDTIRQCCWKIASTRVWLLRVRDVFMRGGVHVTIANSHPKLEID